MIEINEIQQTGDIYTIKYFADGVEQQLETPATTEQLLAFIVENKINVVITDVWDGSVEHIPVDEYLREFTNEVCFKYLSQQSTLSITLPAKQYDNIMTTLKNYMIKQHKEIQFLSQNDEDRKKFSEALVSKAVLCGMDLDFIDTLKL